MPRFLALLLVAGCSARPVGPGSGGTTADTAAPMRPEFGMWAVCQMQGDCGDVPVCVFPADEAGFCTDACEVAEDCPPAYAAGGAVVCVDVGDTEPVCAIDCDGGRTCPPGMRCEAIALPEGARRLCF